MSSSIQAYILQQQKVALGLNEQIKHDVSISNAKKHNAVTVTSTGYSSVLDGTKTPLFFVPKLNASASADATVMYSNAANLLAVISRLTTLSTRANVDQLQMNCKAFLSLKETARNNSQQLATEYQQTLDAYRSVKDELLETTEKLTAEPDSDSGIALSETERSDLVSQLQVATDLQQKLAALRQKMSRQDNNIQMLSDESENQSDMALAIALSALLIKLGGETAKSELYNQLTVFQAAQKSLQNTMVQKAQEFDEQMHKSKLTRLVMKIAGVGVGVLLQALGIIGAAFSGGTSLALSIIGTVVIGGFFLVDKAINYFAGVDPIEWVMNQVMDGLTQVFSELLQKCGLDNAELAKQIGSALSAVTMTVAVIALTALAMYGGGKVVSRFAKPMAKNAMSASLKIMSKVFDGVTAVGQLALVGGESAAGVLNGYFVFQGDNSLSDLKSAQASVKALEDALKNASASFNTKQKEIIQLNESLSSTIQQISETCLQMSKQMRV
ncbi:type III secretion system translocon subunit SctE [Escherichia coli]|nr:YopB/SseC family type III secretion system translocon subunit [Escherichia coli]EKK0607212.1 type III secretion system translocon subunit SctE [Escherichia coli]ELX1912733.1 type III secretion system translocon subunit SctE [Escherichia coli]